MVALSKAKLGGIGLPSWFTKSLEDVYKEKYGGRYPGLAENVASGIGTGLKAIGLPKHVAETTGRNITSLVEDWTPAGALTATEEYGPLGALAAVPFVGAKGKKLAKGLGEAAEHLPNVERPVASVTDVTDPHPAAVKGSGEPVVKSKASNTEIPMSSKVDPVAPQGLGIRAWHGTPEKGLVNLEPRQPALGMKAIYASTNPEHAGPFAKKGMAEGGQVIPLEVSGNIATRKYVTDLYDQGLSTDQIYERLRQEGYAGFYEDTAHEGMGIFDASSIGYPDRPAQGLGGIRAYHGSPHSFEQFDISKIGTGEGAQAYGHGLYFAENEGVARQYRDNLARPDFNVTESGTPISSDLSRMLEDAYDDAMRQGVSSPTHRDAIHLAQQNLDRQRQDALKAKDFDWFNKVSDQITELQRMGKDAPVTKGHMYEVDIAADPEAFLDWDKPLKDQPEYVKKALDVPDLDRPMTVEEYNEALDRFGFLPPRGFEMAQMRGSDLIDEPLRRGLAGTPEERLKAKGLAGIKYLDQGSRGVGEGSRNYVVFDPKLISIVRKYGLAAAIASGLISEEMGRQMQEQGEL